MACFIRVSFLWLIIGFLTCLLYNYGKSRFTKAGNTAIILLGPVSFFILIIIFIKIVIDIIREKINEK